MEIVRQLRFSPHFRRSNGVCCPRCIVAQRLPWIRCRPVRDTHDFKLNLLGATVSESLISICNPRLASPTCPTGTPSDGACRMSSRSRLHPSLHRLHAPMQAFSANYGTLCVLYRAEVVQPWIPAPPPHCNISKLSFTCIINCLSGQAKITRSGQLTIGVGSTN